MSDMTVDPNSLTRIASMQADASAPVFARAQVVDLFPLELIQVGQALARKPDARPFFALVARNKPPPAGKRVDSEAAVV